MKFSIIKYINFLNQAGRMVAEDLELTVETLRCKEDREAGGLVKKVAPTFFQSLKYPPKILYLICHCIALSHCHDIEMSEILPIDAKSGSASSWLLQSTTFNSTEFKLR